MAVAVVQTKTREAFNAFGDAVDAITFDGGTVAGNLVVLAFGNEASNAGVDPVISTVSDGTDNYTSGIQREHSDGSLFIRGAIFYFKPAGSITTLTITLTGNVSNTNYFAKAWEVSGSAASPLDDTDDGQTDVDTVFEAGPVTPTVADAILIGLSIANDPATFTPDADYATGAFIPGNARGVACHRIVSSTNPDTMTNTANDALNGVSLLAVFKGAAVAQRTFVLH